MMNLVMVKKSLFDSPNVQKGQALIETTLVLVIFLIMLFSIIFTQKVSERSSDMLNQGLSMAISSARGATLSGVRFEGIEPRGPTQGDIATNGMQELSTSSSGWFISEMNDPMAVPSILQQSKSLIQPFSLRSVVMVKGNPSHASDPGDAARTLSQTKRMWGTPAALTRQLTSIVTVQAHQTDAAWKRTKPAQDLLSGWKHIAP